MAGFFHSLSDDQIALIGCAAALAVCSMIMWVSTYFGRGLKGERVTDEAQPITLPLPKTADPLPHTRRKAA